MPERKNVCGVMFRHPERGAVGCTRLWMHIEAGPCRNHSLNFEWCGMCDATSCPHMDAWVESSGRAAYELADELTQEAARG